MGKPTGFMEYKRQTLDERNPAERTKDWNDYTSPLSEEEVKKQGARCMDCGVPTCQSGMEINGATTGCPVYHLIPEWNDLVYQGQWKEALKREHQMNNFPEFTGFACPAPCEGACVLGINEPPVAIRTVERSIIEKGFEEGWVIPEPPEYRTGKRVAVVGSGPAGLASAAQLNKAGHLVTVFEKNDRVGGLLTYGIPEMKLPYSVVKRRVDILEEEGIEFVTNTEVGKDYTVENLRENFDAVILCGGAAVHRDIQVDGRDLKGVHYAMEFLHANTKSLLDSNLEDGNYISAEGKNVIVIGGGDTGTDCLATSVRHNCKSLTQFDIYDKKGAMRDEVGNPWPQYPVIHRVEYGQKEAAEVLGEDPRAYAVMTKKFVGDEHGHIKEVHTINVKLRYDEDGNKIRDEIPGTEKVWPADLVLLAIGFSGPEQDLIKELDVETNTNSTVKAEYGKYLTNVDGVFAAGDMRRGQSLIVWAINEGREAARECDRYLMGTTELP
ncbi:MULTISPECIES: glutamate synthase subunit beta [Rossellomorea]|jgi:glutamate synthase (NADPH) small chain|uniref:Glutamate synthase subunit beta n=1 Tax=Rossellomorea aquimaris TaxID=189382 RepID=A0A5D4UMG6_9BACI|nr:MULTISPECIES: glutamate synthase subunit beta [Rossellomorea]MDT9027041.1 glutamate synthase subunit beta [Rossellomorea sp. YC4-1]TYS82130.1 glutamate synthase subunit beta [Rossellomorea aquimaris]TYS88757.1 glutamate synthase subunit beta [Rossellomorea aquimaris]TYS89551.1 glutamate synthase subunit beta [Rossellomorea aquimaris]